MIPAICGLIVGYLFGSVPFSWIAAKLVKGIDIRNYGSGTVSATMIGILISKPLAVLVGCLDVFKALIPVSISRREFTGINIVVYAVGIGVLLGHNWPIWLNFHGGRGVSVILGSLIILFPIGAVYLLLALGLGKIFKAGAIFVLLALGSMPLLVYLFKKPPTVGWFTLAIFLICMIKRIEANREPLPARDKKGVILRRIFLDRDTEDYYFWIHRRK